MQVNTDNLFLQALSTYRTFVNIIIPRSPELALLYGMVQYYGAIDLQVEEYLIITLNRLPVKSAFTVAELLNSVSSPLQIDDTSILNFLVSNTMMGYYSEWAGYGTTKLNEPSERRLEFYPVSWQQIGYPGPSLGYHALRAYNFT